ncbi:hypothetical protein ACHAXR_000138 [Thalassiosira sp. AJA248-18]
MHLTIAEICGRWCSIRASKKFSGMHFTIVNHWRASHYLQPSLRLAIMHFTIASI